eukprot:gene15001-17731_t
MCGSTTWLVAMVAAIVIVVTFVLGFPVSLFLIMRHLHRYRKVRMPRQVAERHVDLVQKGLWIPCSEDDIISVRTRQSFYIKPSEDLQLVRSNRLSFAAVARQLLQAKSPQHDSTPMPAPQDEVQWEAAEEQESCASDTVREPARRWQTLMRLKTTASPVEIYLPRDTFVECAAADPASCQAAFEGLQDKPMFGWMPMLAQLLTGSRRKRPEMVMQFSASGAADDDVDNYLGHGGGSSLLVTKDGRLIKGVNCCKKMDLGGQGAISMVPVTMLDDTIHLEMLDHFRNPFQENFYYWQ